MRCSAAAWSSTCLNSMEQRARDLPVLAGGGRIAAGVREIAEREPRLGMRGLVARGSGAKDALAQELLGLRSYRPPRDRQCASER